jgi:hypothetical protein
MRYTGMRIHALVIVLSWAFVHASYIVEDANNNLLIKSTNNISLVGEDVVINGNSLSGALATCSNMNSMTLAQQGSMQISFNSISLNLSQAIVALAEDVVINGNSLSGALATCSNMNSVALAQQGSMQISFNAQFSTIMTLINTQASSFEQQLSVQQASFDSRLASLSSSPSIISSTRCVIVGESINSTRAPVHITPQSGASPPHNGKHWICCIPTICS